LINFSIFLSAKLTISLRYFVRFSYFGKQYHGWQRQPNAVTVQQVLEEAFSKILRREIVLIGAGRTDTGVHAKEMFAHFDLDDISDFDKLIYRLNALLPEDIAVQEIFTVSNGAHARFDAVERTYEYWIVRKKSPFYSDFSYYIKYPLDIESMNAAAALLLEYEDFECFSKSNTDVKTYRCDVKEAIWEDRGDKIVFTISADRFLRNMVRAIVGTLLDVGFGRLTLDDVKSIINSKDRSNAGPSVPAKGLYLTSVRYPDTNKN